MPGTHTTGQVAVSHAVTRWVVVAAAFGLHLVVDGTIYSFGVFFIHLQDEFRASKLQTAWVGSILSGLFLLAGPLASALVNQFGCRSVVLAGSICASISLVISMAAPNLTVLCVTFGAMLGTSFCMTYLPSVVIIGQHFGERSALAMGVAACGSGVGSFVFAPLCEALLAAYSWRGALLLLAGVVLHGAVFAALLRPPPPQRPRGHPQPALRPQAQETKDKSYETDKWNELTEQFREEGVSDKDVQNGGKPSNESKKSSGGHITTNFEKGVKPGLKFEVGGASAKWADLNSESRLAGVSFNGAELGVVPTGDGLKARMDGCDVKDLEDDEVGNTGCSWRGFCRAVCTAFNPVLLLDPVMVVIICSLFFNQLAYLIPFHYLPAKVVSHGYTRQQAAMVLSIMGIVGAVSRVCGGWLWDRSCVNKLVVFCMAMVLAGVSLGLVPVLTSYGLLAANGAFYSICSGQFVVLLPVIVVKYLGVSNSASAMGSVGLAMGAACFIGLPLAGWLVDQTASFTSSFLLAGGCMTLAGLMCSPLGVLATHTRRRGLGWEGGEGVRGGEGRG